MDKIRPSRAEIRFAPGDRERFRALADELGISEAELVRRIHAAVPVPRAVYEPGHSLAVKSPPGGPGEAQASVTVFLAAAAADPRVAAALEFLAAHELDRSEFRSVAKAVARKGQMIELCRSNSLGAVFVAPSVIEYRLAEDDEVLPETVAPFFYRVSDLEE